MIEFDAAQLFIGGCWKPARSDKRLALFNPSTGEKLAEIAAGDGADIDDAVNAAAQARGGWSQMAAADRGRHLMTLSSLVSANVDELALLEADDVGKPLKQARADALALARYLEYYGGAADKVHGDTIPFQAGYSVYTLREPHGVTGHIIPWNYPMQIIGRSVGAALAMGNCCVVKPAEEACLTVLAFARLAEQAGLPAGTLNVVPGPGETAGAALATHAGVHHVSFTGSVGVGRSVQRAAANHVAPVTLELGGKSPQLVFDDADIDAAMPMLINAGIQNAGQTCSAASRILVQRGIYQEVVDRMAGAYRQLTVGPARADLDVGPLVSPRQREIVEEYLAIASASAGEIVAQAILTDDLLDGGAYVPPTLIAGATASDRIAQEEIFGPVQVVMPFDTEAEGVALANGTDYGLVAGIWTENGGRQMRLARQLEAGQVFINNYGAGGGVELPFGGVKNSGHGREKGFDALYGFSVLKTVAVKHG